MNILCLFPKYRELESHLEGAVLKASAMEARAREAETAAGNDRLELKGCREELQDRNLELVNLRNAYDELTTEKLRLSDRLDSVIADKDRLWSLFETANSGLMDSLKMQVNHLNQRSGAGIPYPEAGSLPVGAVKIQEGGPIGRRGRMLPSQAAVDQVQEFVRSEYGPRVAKSIMEQIS